MSGEDLIATNRASRDPVGFYAHWGPQAWIDMWMSDSMLVKKAMPIISHTFLPVLRLVCEDVDRLERDYEDIRARRERVRWFDSPREKWRRRYGNFVRELEWALLELRKYFGEEQYRAIVIGTSVKLSRENSGDFLEMMNGISRKGSDRKRKDKPPAGAGRPSRRMQFMFDTFNPAHWLTGPATITEYDPDNGLMVMEVPDCVWHSCSGQETLPDPNALPEEGCLAICKGAFEALFDGTSGGLRMEFDPHLPETSCTVRMTWVPGGGSAS